ncbi:hypothetical protein HOY80DRAFT_1035686 [Tuber brumale]|nr:hypothetical protein HOY80DRAFT_1035686 [Tuber brumale]
MPIGQWRAKFEKSPIGFALYGISTGCSAGAAEAICSVTGGSPSSSVKTTRVMIIAPPR